MSHEVESMFSVKQTPWHKLGKVVNEATSIAEAIRLAGLDWHVTTRTAYDRFTNHFGTLEHREVDANVVVRDDTNAVLGIVGKKWKPLQNVDAFKWFEPFVEEGLAKLETAGSLREGRRVWILAEINKEPLEISEGDLVRRFLLLSNGHDGTLAIRVGFTPIRVVCANTLAMAYHNGNSFLIRLRHSSKAVNALNDLRETMNLANQSFEATAAQYRGLTKYQINREDLKKYITRVLDLTEKEGKLVKQSADVMAGILASFDGEGKGSTLPGSRGTWWGAYNAVTEYLSYTRGKKEDNRLDSLWFGDSAAINQSALELALDLAA